MPPFLSIPLSLKAEHWLTKQSAWVFPVSFLKEKILTLLSASEIGCMGCQQRISQNCNVTVWPFCGWASRPSMSHLGSLHHPHLTQMKRYWKGESYEVSQACRHCFSKIKILLYLGYKREAHTVRHRRKIKNCSDITAVNIWLWPFTAVFSPHRHA